jgi:membrane-associated protein
MTTIQTFVHIILHLNLYLGALINEYGTETYVLLFLVIFCETGLVIMPFLPGDSLLFAAGSLMASSQFNIHHVVVLLIIAALCGDNVNYWLGRWLGPKIFNNHGPWLQRKHLIKTHQFYKKYGAKTIIIARFIPIIRTFAPFVAGIGKMNYGKYLCFSIFAAILWVCLLMYVGYYFGNIPWLKAHFSTVIMVIILFSLLPPFIQFLRYLWKKPCHENA